MKRQGTYGASRGCGKSLQKLHLRNGLRSPGNSLFGDLERPLGRGWAPVGIQVRELGFQKKDPCKERAQEERIRQCPGTRGRLCEVRRSDLATRKSGPDTEGTSSSTKHVGFFLKPVNSPSMCEGCLNTRAA